MNPSKLAHWGPVTAWRSRDRTRSILAFGVVLYVVRVIAPKWRGDFEMFFPDSSSYAAVTRIGPFDPTFWWSERPIGVPLALWLTGNNERVFFLLQTALFAIALAHLCSVLLRVIATRWLAWSTCAAVVSVGVHPRFGLWHLEILSESLSLTTSVFMISLWLLFMCEGRRRTLIAATGVSLVWVSLRDVHIVFALVVAIALGVSALVMRRWEMRRTAGLAAATLIAFSGYVSIAQGVSDRNIHPLINNIGERVLPDAELTDTFVDRGMPMNDALRERSGADAWSDGQAFLVSPQLEDFRQWARDDGRRALATSLVVDAAFWIDTSREALTSSLPLDFAEYDRNGTSDRLPTRLFWFQGPRTAVQLSIWCGAAVVALIVLAVRRRRLAFAGLIAAVAVCADIVVSASGDSVEVQRHLLGGILRLTLLAIIITAFGIQNLIDAIRRSQIERREVASDSSRPPMSISVALSTAVSIIGLFGTWIALEHRSRDYDPQYARTIIERAARFGGTYYENGVHNKGPLETAVYDSVRIFTDYDTYWFGISAYVIAVSLVLSGAAAIVARRLGASPRVAGTAAILVFAHFTLSDSDYAGVLYSRNITTAILALVFACSIWNTPWVDERRARLSFIVSFALVGLAVQTLLPTVFAAAVIGSFVLVRRSRAAHLQHPLLVAGVAASSAFASAPIWYAFRGSFPEFWSNWWTYAQYMSSSTGRSLLDQFGLGFQKIFGYYQERPAIFLLVAGYALVVRASWRESTTSERTIHATLFAWFVAGWIELVLSQRYSSHYFSILAVPTSLMAVAAVSLSLRKLHDWRELPRVSPLSFEHDDRDRPVLGSPRQMWTSIAIVFAVVAAQGTHSTWNAIEGAGAFRSTAHYVETRKTLRTGSSEMQQAVMDLVSDADDPLLAWTMYPWTYLDNRRVPATRFSWKSFLIGEIYLGRTSPRYVLPDTWKLFDDDIRRTRPRVYARPQVTALVPNTPFARLVARDFAIVYADDQIEIGWQRNLREEATRPFSADSAARIASLPAGWSYESSTNSIDIDTDAMPWIVDVESCQRFGLRLQRIQTADPTGIRIEFAPGDEFDRSVAMNIDFDRSWSERPSSARSGTNESDDDLSDVDLYLTNRLSLDVTLLLTDSAAALIVDDAIVSAVLLDGPQTVSISSLYGRTRISRPTIDRLTSFAGC